MSGVIVSKYARAPIQTAQWVRNGKPVVAELQNAIAELTGFVMVARPKFLFARSAAIVTTGGSTLIPTSTTGERARWRFAWRSGPYASRLAVYLELAPQNAGSPANPYVSLDVTNGNGTEIGYARRYYGSSDGSYDDVPRNFGGGISFLSADRRYAGNPAYLTPNTDYWAVFSDNDYARLVAAAVWEISLTPDTDNGYPSTSVAANSMIADKDRQDVVTASRTLWKKGGQQLINWCSDTDATAPSSSSGSLSGVLASTLGTLTVSASGTVVGSGPPVWSAAGSIVSGSSSTISPAWPSHSAGHVGFLVIEERPAGAGTMPTFSSQASFELLEQYAGGAEGETTVSVYWRRAIDSSSADPVINAVAGGTSAIIFTLNNVVPFGSPADVTGEIGSSASTSVTWPDVTTTVNDTLVLNVLGYQASASSSSGENNSSLTSLTERIDANHSSGTYPGGIVVETGLLSTAGATGSTTATMADSVRQSMVTAAIKGPQATAVPTFYWAGSGYEYGATAYSWPYGHTVDDVAILVVESGAESISLSVANGFTEISGTSQSTGVLGAGAAIKAYWCRATSGSMSGPTIADSGNHTRSLMVVVRGAAYSGDPIDVASGSTAGSGTSVSFPSVTTTTDKCLIVQAVAHNANASVGSYSNAGLSSIIERNDATGAGAGYDNGLALITGTKATAGAVGTTTATLTSAGYQALITLAIKPA